MHTLEDLISKYKKFNNDNAFRTWLQKEYDAGNISIEEVANLALELAKQIEEEMAGLLGDKNGENKE